MCFLRRAVPGVLLVSAVLFGGPVWPQAFVDYVEGSVTLASGEDWHPVRIGDQLPPDGTLQLGARGYVEVQDGGVRITLRREGLYDMRQVLQQAQAVHNPGVAGLLAGKLRALGGRAVRSEAMGVRGAEQSSPGVTWADDASLTVAEARELLEQDRPQEALDLLYEAVDFASDSQQESLLWYQIGFAHSMQGQTREALEALLALPPAVDADYVGGYVLLTGRLLLEALELDVARQMFASYLPHLRGNEDTQVAFILSALVHRGLGDQHEAQVALRRAAQLNPDNPAGQTALELLQ